MSSEKWHNPYSPYPLTGKPFTVAETVSRNVYLFCRGGPWDGAVIRAEVQDLTAYDEYGHPIPPVVILPCPACNRGLKVDGYAKKVVMQYFDKPKPLDLREIGFGLVEQTGILSVGETCGCPYVNSDAPCGARFRIQENILSKV